MILNLILLKKKQVSAMLNSESLKVYENWFSNFDINNRKIFRVIEKNDKNNSLGKIKDISIKEFENNNLPQNNTAGMYAIRF